jgi:SAM-dependent MidA family methyltransferase
MDDLQPGLRRVSATDLSDVGDDPALLRRIRDEILATGPMPFVRFMELALYAPEGGYYRAASARPGREGDFITAPELHPIFGQTLSTAIEEIWRRLGEPTPFVLREHGAGTGTLGLAVLNELHRVRSPLLDAFRYAPIEIEADRIGALESRFARSGWDGVLAAPGETGGDGMVLANEVLDALPVHRVRRRVDSLREVAIELGPDDGLVEVEIDPSTPALAARLASEAIELIDGQTAEICLALDAWIAAAVSSIERGVLLLIDYGAPAAALYDPVRRRDGTLRAYLRHQVHDDPYRHVGRQDLTAHVDVTAVERAAHAAGLTTIGITTQAEALMGLGIEGRLQAIQADPATTFEDYSLVRSALVRLLDPAAMGRFEVMAFGRDWPAPDEREPPLGLFSYRLPGRADRRC